MRSQEMIAAICLSVSPTVNTADLYRFGPLAERLPAEDLAAITVLAKDNGGSPWALLGWYSMVLPAVRYVDAFLPPTLSTARLKRGPVLGLQCSPAVEEAACMNWVVAQTNTTYVQVADRVASFNKATIVRSPSERPIRVTGTFSDHDLLTLVTYIRSRPSPPAPRGLETLPVSGAYPIMDIEQQEDGPVSVRMSADGGVGETATVIRKRGKWQVTQVVGWVA